MKAIMLSIQPKWCELIANGKKTIEVRKTCPKLETPFKCYIYATKSKRDEIGHIVNYSFRSGISFDVGKIIGEFVCDRIEGISKKRLGSLSLGEFEDVQKSCLTEQQIWDYCGNKAIFYMWHISDLVIYNKPKELGDFFVEGECDEKNCETCRYLHQGCGWLDGSYYDEDYCEIMDGIKPLTRPPQSWCYTQGIRG